jgi:hypothetical protein
MVSERDATAEAFGDFRPGRLAWERIMTLVFSTPVLLLGRRGIFDLPDQFVHDMERGILVGGTHAAL